VVTDLAAPLHTVTIDWDNHGCHTFTCHAPADALCRASWDCTCEEWIGLVVEDGVPWHDAGTDVEVGRHRGRFDGGGCNLRDWYDECRGADLLTGEVTFPVLEEWERDGHYTFKVQAPAPSVTPEQIETARQAMSDTIARSGLYWGSRAAMEAVVAALRLQVRVGEPALAMHIDLEG
jgi:hypothetical protein